MAHRFNLEYGRKTPKPHARDRTWSRWRINRNIIDKHDEERVRKLDETKIKIAERFDWLKNLGKKKITIPDFKVQRG